MYASSVVQVLQDVRHTQQNVTDAAAIPTMFKTKETTATVTWSGAFEIGDQMKISVKVCIRSHPTDSCPVCRSRASPSEQMICQPFGAAIHRALQTQCMLPLRMKQSDVPPIL